jgi:hypothetical protein
MLKAKQGPDHPRKQNYATLAGNAIKRYLEQLNLRLIINLKINKPLRACAV